MKSEIPPAHTRVFGLANLIFLGAFCAFWFFMAGDFPWILVLVVAVGTPVFLYFFLLGPHVIFSLDNDAIAWCKDLKRRSLTRIPTTEVKEVHLIETGEGDTGMGYKLIIAAR